jgi:hypothetical protein
MLVGETHPTSSVCSDSQGGGSLTFIFCPLYETAGVTNLILPARECYVTDQTFAPRPFQGSLYLDLYRYLSGNRLLGR